MKRFPAFGKFSEIYPMKLPEIHIPIIEIPAGGKVRLFMKREDLVHPEISGNKYWKLFYNINHYLDSQPQEPLIITFGGAYSNHISAVAALGKNLGIRTLGIIRGDELSDRWMHNPTLHFAHCCGMDFRFVSRTAYRDKTPLKLQLKNEFPNALVVPEGGTNLLAVEGVRHMLNEETKSFDYLCTAVGTGGTVAGISKFSNENQKVMGFKVVDDQSVEKRVSQLSPIRKVEFMEAHFGGYGKITDENVRFINGFSESFGIPLDPVYTGKMMQKIFELIDQGFFPENSRILAFHTGGLQGIDGANTLLAKQHRTLIEKM